MRRNSKGQFAKSLSRFVPIYVLTFTVALGLPGYYKDSAIVQRYINSTTAVASDLPAGQQAVQNEIVNTVGSGQDEIKPLGESKTTPAPTVVLKLEVAPTPVVTPRPGSKQEIFAYIVEKFGDDAADMITIIRKCENSKFDQSATNHNNNGTIDYGIAQINSIHIPRCGADIKTDWKANIDCAHSIYERAGNSFRPWTCAHIVGQKNYLNQ